MSICLNPSNWIHVQSFILVYISIRLVKINEL